MPVKVLTVESSAWNADTIQQASVLGEFSDEGEALTEIWRDLVHRRQHRAYLLFQSHRWLTFLRRPTSIVWAGLYQGMPRIYQEALDMNAEKKATKVYALAA